MLRATGGLPVVLGGVETVGHIDRRHEEVPPGEATGTIAHVVEITVPTGALPALAVGATLTCDGATYRVRSIREMDDGGLTVIGVEAT